MADSTKKFDGQEYKISIVGKHIEITKPIREYIEGKILKIEHLTNHIIDIRVSIDVQKLTHVVDIIMKFSHFKIKVGAVTENMYSAVDKAFDRLDTKLRRWKGRIQDHHAKGVAVIEMEVEILKREQREIEEINREIIDANNRAIDSDYSLPQVIKKKKRPLKLLTLEEAVMKMELSDDNFMVYRSEEEQTLKIIYRRSDGNYGIISPE